MHPFRARVKLVYVEDENGDGGCYPSRHHGVAEQHVCAVEDSVEDDDGDGDVEGHAEVFLKHGHRAEADGADKQSLHVVSPFKPIVDERDAQFEGA